MSNTMTFTAFAPPTREGIDLARRAAAAAEALGITASVAEAVNAWTLLSACLTDDVVLFDGTIEPDGSHLYPLAAIMPAQVDHLLVAARTYLPINFIPARRGGAPEYPFPHFDPRLDRVRAAWSNDHILRWVETQLRDLRGRGPRAKTVDLSALTAGGDADQIARAIAEFYQASAPRVERERRVFVSYRSRHWERMHPFVARLERGELHGGAAKEVEVVPPGQVVYEGELLTAMRRWQLLALVDRRIATCAEMVAYRTPDYLDSWWTQGEVITLAYRRCAGSPEPVALRVFDPARGDAAPLACPPPGLLPTLPEPQLRRMARWYAHTDPYEMGPETVWMNRLAHRLIRFVPDFMLRAVLKRAWKTPPAQVAAATLRAFDDGAGDPERFVGETQDPAMMRDFYGDEVWSAAFWENVLFDCPATRREARAAAPDVAGFLTARPAQMESITPAEMERFVAEGAIRCARCNGRHPVVAAPPRFLWAPPRAGLPGAGGLQRLDTHVALPDPRL